MAATASGIRTLDEGGVVEALRVALIAGALPGETANLDAEASRAAAAFVARVARTRAPATPVVEIETMPAAGGERRMRLAVINDDMPFLVDSVAAAISARCLTIHRLLHPIVNVARDEKGRLLALDADGPRESILYLEVERSDARLRRTLQQDLLAALGDVRAAVADWAALQQVLRADADTLPEGEGAALLRWFADGSFTLLAHAVQDREGGMSGALGLVRVDGEPLWNAATRKAAFAHFEGGREAPLIIKSDRLSTVHRRVPLDLLIVPVRQGGVLVALSIHAGLWTSAALATSAEDVPMLRTALAEIEARHGFASSGHAGKSLRHALSALPHDLLVAAQPAAVEALALTAMSLIDRPRPKLLMIADALALNAFAFVWVPREELSTARRNLIGEMLREAAGGRLVSWSMDLGEGDLALVRYMIRLTGAHVLPDIDRLDAQIVDLVRGWVPAVEAGLVPLVGAGRASRLAIAYAAAFPQGYRARYDAPEAARDVQALHLLGGGDGRSVRLFLLREDPAERVHLKVYRRAGPIMLSEVVPVLENFGFRVVEEVPTLLDGGRLGHIHDFLLEADSAETVASLAGRASLIEPAVAAVLDGRAEDDEFNALLGAGVADERAVVLFRAWFRYLRQTGLAYGLATAAQALRRASGVAAGIIALFDARHDPARADDAAAQAAEQAIERSLAAVSAIDDDRILRRLAAVVRATLRTNAFSPAAAEALAFKFDSAAIPGLPAPVPWREIFVYSPRVEGIHLRGGPIARGGIRWSDRRDDFRTEILGLMKAQIVKNAVIVPTGAKGGFYAKRLPPARDRDAWLAEGTESYRIFIRALLSVTDNIVDDAVRHPDTVVVRDEEDPYFVVAADKGTASFSDVANGIALERDFWLGDAFASGGSQGYDHKEMGITARGAWISVQRHFAEMGVDVQSEAVTVAGVGDMSGDVFGNGMLLSKAIKLVAAFDHRHIFLDPDPDPARSFEERRRLFALPRSSWADYDTALLSKGGGIFPRDQKQIPLSAEVRQRLGIEAASVDPATLMSAILKAPVDLLWFGGIGTYVKAADEANAEVGDNANDAVRVNGEEVRARVIGEGANLGVTQAGRIAYAEKGGRLNADFIDNSAGVDCSDNEVNIKIALNAEMRSGRLSYEDRNRLLTEMTQDVAQLVLEDNRLQTLALSLAERGGPGALPSQVRAIEMMEAAGRLNRTVEGLESNEELLRRGQDARGLTRPELAVLLSHAKLAMQTAIEASSLPDDPLLLPLLRASFPPQMQERYGDAIAGHRLRREIIATELANIVVNRLGFLLPLEIAEEEGGSLAQVASAYVAADVLFDLAGLWRDIEQADVPEATRLTLFATAGGNLRGQLADLLRAFPSAAPSAVTAELSAGVSRVDAELHDLLREETRKQGEAQRDAMAAMGVDEALARRISRLEELDGAIGSAMLARTLGVGEVEASRAYVRLGEALALDWAKAAAMRFSSADPWERLLVAGLARDFEQLRLDCVARIGGSDPNAAVDEWLAANAPRVAQFARIVARARATATPTAAMLAQIGQQTRALLAR